MPIAPIFGGFNFSGGPASARKTDKEVAAENAKNQAWMENENQQYSAVLNQLMTGSHPNIIAENIRKLIGMGFPEGQAVSAAQTKAREKDIKLPNQSGQIDPRLSKPVK